MLMINIYEDATKLWGFDKTIHILSFVFIGAGIGYLIGNKTYSGGKENDK